MSLPPVTLADIQRMSSLLKLMVSLRMVVRKTGRYCHGVLGLLPLSVILRPTVIPVDFGVIRSILLIF
jgi:hypothetical protein